MVRRGEWPDVRKVKLKTNCFNKTPHDHATSRLVISHSTEKTRLKMLKGLKKSINCSNKLKRNRRLRYFAPSLRMCGESIEMAVQFKDGTES